MSRTTRYSTSSMGQYDEEMKNSPLGDRDTENKVLRDKEKREKLFG